MRKTRSRMWKVAASVVVAGIALSGCSGGGGGGGGAGAEGEPDSRPRNLLAEFEDRLRGISGTRRVILMNRADMDRLALNDQDFVTLETHVEDGVERRVGNLRVHAFDVPPGDIAGYYPELNCLIPLWHHAEESHVPAAKSVPVRMFKSSAPQPA